MDILPKKTPPKFSKPPSFNSTVGQSLLKDNEDSDPLFGMPLLRTPNIGTRGGWIERFKGLKPRELAFIATGLGVLIMAPLTEYLMVNPKSASRSLQGGFAEHGSVFSEGAPGTYEGGLQGIAQGGLVGQEGDVITPLGARDPSQLIVGPAGEDKSATAPSAPATSTNSKQENGSGGSGGSSWKEALSAAKSGASAAMHKASGLPRPSQALSGTLRGLSALTSGSGGGPSSSVSSPKLDSPSSKGLISPPRQESSLSRIQTAPGFRGTATGTGMLNAARSNAGFAPGSGAPFLQDMSYGKSSGGGAPEGAAGKPSEGQDAKASGTSSKDAKTMTPAGESLTMLRAKMEMQKSIDLKYKKMEYQQIEKQKIWNQAIAQAVAQLPGQILQAATQALILKRQQQGQGGGGGGGGGDNGGFQAGPTEKGFMGPEQGARPADGSGPTKSYSEGATVSTPGGDVQMPPEGSYDQETGVLSHGGSINGNELPAGTKYDPTNSQAPFSKGDKQYGPGGEPLPSSPSGGASTPQ